MQPVFLCWANNGSGSTTLGRVSLDGRAVAPKVIKNGGARPCGVTVFGRYLYWATQDGGTIGRANLDGTHVASFITGRGSPCGVAVSNSHIYWADNGGSIGRANLDGTDVKPRFIGGAYNACGAAVDGSHIYWANRAP